MAFCSLCSLWITVKTVNFANQGTFFLLELNNLCCVSQDHLHLWRIIKTVWPLRAAAVKQVSETSALFRHDSPVINRTHFLRCILLMQINALLAGSSERRVSTCQTRTAHAAWRASRRPAPPTGRAVAAGTRGRSTTTSRGETWSSTTA